MFIAHILAHSLVVSIVRIAKEINNLEKNAEELETRVRNARKDLTSEDSLFPVPQLQAREETLDERKSAGTVFHRMQFIPSSTNRRPKFL